MKTVSVLSILSPFYKSVQVAGFTKKCPYTNYILMKRNLPQKRGLIAKKRFLSLCTVGTRPIISLTEGNDEVILTCQEVSSLSTKYTPARSLEGLNVAVEDALGEDVLGLLATHISVTCIR